MGPYTNTQLNNMFKHIMLMNGPEIEKELEILERMSVTLKILLHPVSNSIESLEEKAENIVKIYVSFKYGSLDDDEAMNSILEHKLAILSIITANAAIGSTMIGYLNADKEIIQEKSTASIETVAVLYGNEKVTETEDSKDTNIDTSAKGSLKNNTQKFLDIINNGVK